MEANTSRDNRWTVFIPGGDLCTDAQIIESTDDEISTSDNDQSTQPMEEGTSLPRPEGLKINGKYTRGGAAWGLFGENWKQLSPTSSSESGTSDIIEEEDLHLYLNPTQPSQPQGEDGIAETESIATGGSTDNQDGLSDVSQSSETFNCHAPSCSSCGPKSVTASTQTLTPEVCRKYAAGTCEYGIGGEKCKYAHPEACKALLKYG